MRILIFFLIFSTNIMAEEIVGIPRVIDGDTVHINNQKIRLEGIDAPEKKQRCKKEKLRISFIINYIFYEKYNCGEVSKKRLIAKIKRSKIKCITSSNDRYKRYLATCFKDKINLNKWMVRNGYAIAYRRYSKKYISDEDFAKQNKLGLWQGKFTNPEKWRKLN